MASAFTPKVVICREEDLKWRPAPSVPDLPAAALPRSLGGVRTANGLLRDVLLGHPHHMQLLPTNSVSRRQLQSGVHFDHAVASSQHRELADAFASAGVRIHYLEADPSLPYQVFARDSSVMTPYGSIVTQMSQSWRRGEHAPVTRFLLDNDIPIYDIVTAGGFEGGDFNVVRPKSLLLGYSEERTQLAGATQVQRWLEAEVGTYS